MALESICQSSKEVLRLKRVHFGELLVELRALKADIDANKEIKVLKKLSKKSNFS